MSYDGKFGGYLDDARQEERREQARSNDGASGASRTGGGNANDWLSRYGPNARIIGLKNAALRAKDTNSGPSAGTSLTQTTAYDEGNWDEIRSDAARILLTNSSGSSIDLAEVTLIGTPIIQITGDSGMLHDGFKDEGDIEKNGPKVFRFGNDDVVTKSQLEELADYWWKFHRTSKHIYIATMSGMRHFLSVGEWYKLAIGSAGKAEYIDSTVELYNIRMRRGPGEIGQTVCIFREVEEAWKKDSTVQARFIASGGTAKIYNNKQFITIGSQYYTGNADLYCDGTSDETEINQAITLLNGAGIQGVVHLSSGQFNIDGSIDLASNVTLEGEGIGATIIEKNCDDYAIDITGGSGSEIEGVTIRGLQVTRNASDTNSNYLLYMDYADNCAFERLVVDDGYTTNIYVSANCEGNAFLSVNSKNSGARGVDVRGDETNLTTVQCSSNTTDGLYVAAEDCAVVSVSALNNSGYGIYIDGLRNSYRNCVLSGNTSTAPTVRYGDEYIQMVDGTADQTEINECITELSSGGLIHLSSGQFNIDGSIDLASNVTLEGEGIGATIIEKNCNDHGLDGSGASGSELENITVRNLTVTRNASDSNDQDLVHATYVDSLIVQDVALVDAYYRAGYFSNCDDITVANLSVIDWNSSNATIPGLQFYINGGSITNIKMNSPNVTPTSATGMYLHTTGSGGIDLNSISIKNISASSTVQGILIAGTSNGNIRMANIIVSDLSMSSDEGSARGLDVSNDEVVMSNVKVTNIDNTTTASLGYGVLISADNTAISNLQVTGCSGIGVLVDSPASQTSIVGGRTWSNGTDYTDNGSNTSISSFSIT